VGDIAIPYLFAALMAIEFGWNAWRGNGYQTPRDSAVSLMVAVPHFTTLAILPVIWVVLYRGLANRCFRKAQRPSLQSWGQGVGERRSPNATRRWNLAAQV
jgi:hypothetical protein